ncbi:hypothetical protein J8273_4324 [Carpediemonas membranifera]|uniref:Uncharacterized protein n=1 Tax=Carpediemonas membranifera TaxID=201153 RepID=A0A8J6E4A9_9EUKA|nr:hypothetical protein J8273_4324 [Carpediemonas membranifera]|eukprot:KAG9394222.1 hypothetical protein J8273_4324 [Carpediemonas membranifera]
MGIGLIPWRKRGAADIASIIRTSVDLSLELAGINELSCAFGLSASSVWETKKHNYLGKHSDDLYYNLGVNANFHKHDKREHKEEIPQPSSRWPFSRKQQVHDEEDEEPDTDALIDSVEKLIAELEAQGLKPVPSGVLHRIMGGRTRAQLVSGIAVASRVRILLDTALETAKGNYSAASEALDAARAYEAVRQKVTAITRTHVRGRMGAGLLSRVSRVKALEAQVPVLEDRVARIEVLQRYMQRATDALELCVTLVDSKQ